MRRLQLCGGFRTKEYATMRLLLLVSLVAALAPSLPAGGQEWLEVPLPIGPSGGNPKILDIAMEGSTVWFSTLRDGIIGYDGAEWVLHTLEDGGLRSNNYRYIIFVDSDGDKWTSKDNSDFAVDRLDDGGSFLQKDDDTWTYYNSPTQLQSNRVFAMAEDFAGNKWFGIRDESSNNTEPTTLELLVENDPDTTTDDEWLTFDYFDDESLFFDDDVRGLAVDHENRLWIAYAPEGVGMGLDVWDFGNYYSVDDDAISHYGQLEGLPSRSIYDVHVGPDGRVWVGTGEGPAYLDPSTGEWVAIDGITARTRSIASDAQGHIWAGTDEGIVMLYASGEVVATYTALADGLHDDEIVLVAVDQTGGTVWAVSQNDNEETFLNVLESGFGPEPRLFVYPNPWKAGETAERSVNILGAPEGSSVEIFDIMGQTVRRLDARREPYVWNSLDDELNEVPSGVYVVRVKTPAGELMFTKVAIIR